MFVIALLATLICAAPSLQAQTIPLQVEPHVLQPGEEVSYQWPAGDLGEQHVLLDFEEQMDSEELGGSMFYLDLTVNGETVAAAVDALTDRLLNKPVSVPWREGTMLSWYSAGSGWRIVYAPDFTSFGDAQGHGPEPYRFLVDVTELIEPGATNTITFHRRVGVTPRPMVIRNVSIQLADEGAPLTASEHELPGVTGWNAQLREDGAIVIEAGGTDFVCTSRFSEPRVGYHALGSDGADDDFSVAVSQPQERRWLAEAQCSAWSLLRTVEATDDRVTVSDRLTNLGDRPVGVMHRMDLSLGEHPVPVAWLQGASDPARLQVAEIRGNPTIFVPFGSQFGIGLAIEDDVTRNHASLHFEPRSPLVGFADERLAIAPGESYEIRWSLYPSLHGDYWRFINQVRADWQVNDITVNGPWGFIQPEKFAGPNTDSEALREQLARGGQHGILTGGGWNYAKGEPPKWIGFGVGVLNEPFDDYRQSLKQCIANFKAADPEVEFLVYQHCFYNSPQTEEQKQRFADSWVTDEAGEQLIHGWSSAYKSSPMVYPTLTNTFGSEFMDLIDLLMDEFGADGIYQDESNNPAVSYTYNEWEGHSAVIDPETFEITSLIGNITLLSSPFRQAMHEHIIGRGGMHVANGAPNVMAENQQPFPRFVEAQNYALRAGETHLYTPLVWDFGNYDAARLRRNLSMGTIPVRLNVSVDGGPVAHFYPLTTLELHEGWILARERIIISESGEYCWPGESVAARLLAWDADLVEQPSREVMVDGPTRVDVPPGGIAVIERVAPR